MKKLIAAAVAVLVLSGRPSSADVASQNIVMVAEAFEVQRIMVGISGITGDFIFFAEGRCSFEAGEHQITEGTDR